MHPWLGITALMPAQISEKRVLELDITLFFTLSDQKPMIRLSITFSCTRDFPEFLLLFLSDFWLHCQWELFFLLCFFYQMHHPQSSHTGIGARKTHNFSLTCKTAHAELSLILGNKKVYSLGFISNTDSQVRTKEIGLHIVDNHFSGCPSKILFWSWWDYISYRDWGGNLDSVFSVVLE